MKFEALLETLELREFRGEYLPYSKLKRQLFAVTQREQQGRIMRTLSTATSAASRRMSVTEDAKQPLDFDDAIQQWRETVQREVMKIARRLDVGLRELHVGLSALKNIPQAANIEGAGGNAAAYLEIQSLDAFDNLGEGVGRYRSFGEANYAAMIRLMQAYDKELGSDEGVNILLPQLAQALDMERFDALEMNIKEAVREVCQVQGIEANSRVTRMMAGLGTLRKASLGSGLFDRSVFGLGLVFGFCGALTLMTIVLCNLPATQPETYNNAYFLAPLGLFRLTLSVPLVYWSMGAVTWVCDHKRINYMFVLGVDPRCQVSSSFFFKRAAFLTSCWMLIFIGYVLDYKFLFMFTMSEDSRDGPGVPRGSRHFFLYPLATLLITLCVELGPSRVFNYSYRWAIIKSLGRFACAPWFFVVFADNLIGDIVTSLSRPLQDVSFALCYMGAHHPQTEADLEHFAQHQSHCGDWERAWFRPLITGLPLMFRALQCLRRYRDTEDFTQVKNFLKYCTAICVILAGRLGADKMVVLAVSITATVYATSWDVFKDWGLSPAELHRIYLEKRAERVALRAVLEGDLESNAARQLPFLAAASNTPSPAGTWARQTSVDLRSTAQQKRLFGATFYGCAILFDMFARSTWALNYLPISFITKNLNDQAALFFCLVVIEISRRAVWVIIRLEWEQVSNASGFRALLWVPVRIQDSYRRTSVAKKRLANGSSNGNGMSAMPTIQSNGSGMKIQMSEK